jgi:hypothetical protein
MSKALAKDDSIQWHQAFEMFITFLYPSLSSFAILLILAIFLISIIFVLASASFCLNINV